MVGKNAAARASAPVRDRGAVAALKARFLRQDAILVVLLFVALLVWPMFPSVKGWMAQQAALVLIYIMAAQGVSILTGYTGLVTVGHGGFLAIGAYTAALLLKHYNVDIIVAVIAGGAVSSFVGVLLGLIFLRLGGPFMAIGTLGFAFFVGTMVNNLEIFEGRTGISLPANHILGFELDDKGFYWVTVGFLALVTLFIWSLVRSGVGRAFKALRDSEKAAESSGVSRWFYRTLAFSISSCITGMAGALNGLITHYVSSEVYADVWYSVDILVAAVVGGSATLLGPFVGGAFVALLPFFLEELADFAFILKGVVLILVLMFAPAGVVALLVRPLRAWRQRQLLRAGSGEAAPPMPAGAAVKPEGRA
ncbi:MAG: branched-chain amino acid ABC transporter permease [Pseudomonadota bacterium]